MDHVNISLCYSWYLCILLYMNIIIKKKKKKHQQSSSLKWRQQNPVYKSPLPISRDFSSDREPQSHTVTEPSVDAAKTSPGLQEILEGTQNIVYEAREEIPGVWYTGNRLISCSYVALGWRCSNIAPLCNITDVNRLPVY